MTRERAAEVVRLAQERAGWLPWSEMLKYILTNDENAEVMRKWDTMPGNTCFVDALLRFRNGE